MKRLFAIALVLLPVMQVKAAPAVNVSLVPDVALYGRSTRIEGFILNVWGENPQKAFALGLVNGSTGDSSGLSLAVIANYAEDYTGAHLGFVNWAKGSFTGLQWGAINYAQSLHGLQLGFVNFARRVDSGIQIGFINFISDNKTWFNEFPDALAPFFFIANWRF